MIFCILIITIILPTSLGQNRTQVPKPNNKPKQDEKPTAEFWPANINVNNTRPYDYTLADWLLTGKWSPENVKLEMTQKHDVEYEGYDGFYNNLARIDSGAIDRPLLRRWPAAYEDGSYAPSGSNRPNPLELSEALLAGPTGSRSTTGKNALIVFFGQQVVEEILDAQRPACPPEYFNIPIPENHIYRKVPGHTEMPFLRTRSDQRTGYGPNNPRQQLNEITPYLDGGLFYGITKQWADQLRTYENGTIDPDGCLASSHGGLFPAYNTDRLPMANPPPPIYHSMFIKSHETAKVSRFFKLGNPRGNENSFLLSFGIMWFRWHNYIAKRIRHHNPSWSSEQVFNEARKWVIATQQRIVIYEWLPEWINSHLPPYEKYDPSVNPQIDQFFQAAAFRFGHTLVVPGVYLRDYIRNGCKKKFDTWGSNTVRTCNSFWRPYEPIVKPESNVSSNLIDIDRLFMGMAVQLCEQEDHKIVEDLRGNVFGPLEFPRRDLMAINIQRGRDHGLPDYNTARKAYGLQKRTFHDFKGLDNEIIDKFEKLYNSSDNNIDIWIGGILETEPEGPGELFRAIIKDQFIRIRNGDRFWFENKQNDLFTSGEISRIKQISIYDILMAVTKMNPDDIPKYPFLVPQGTDPIHNTSCGLTKSSCKKQTRTYDCYHLPLLNDTFLNEPCVTGVSYDYFSNSEISYVMTFIALGTFMIGSIGVIFILIKLKERKNILKLKNDNEVTRDSVKQKKNITYPLFGAIEWTGHRKPERKIVIGLKINTSVLEVMSEEGEVLRAIDFANGKQKTEVYQIKDAPYLIVKCKHDYDLVLKFENDLLRNHFLSFFDPFLKNTKRENITTFSLSAALKRVTTRQDRQLLLEKFYRVLFAQAFNIKYSHKKLLDVDESVRDEIVNTELTISEFADALSMRSKDEFVQRMFNLVDKDKNGFISFREFVDLLIIFANGDEQQKAKLLFDMYDINAVGYLTEDNFMTMIKSFLATVEGKVEEEKLQKTIKGMLSQAGLHNKQKIKFDDFIQLFGHDIKNLSKAKLNIKSTAHDRLSYLEVARDTILNIYESPQDIQRRFQGDVKPPQRDTSKIIDDKQDELITKDASSKPKFPIVRYLELKSQEIFWLSLYTLVLWAIFIERAYYYSVEREHSGLRRIAGYGVTVTRGAASAMMFTYSSLLITMCRNTITYLRDTILNKYFPFDASVEIHKYIAVWAFIFTVLHIVGHAFNFYHISTQTADDLTCLFRNFFHATHELPKFHYWCWQTITGLTGVLLTLIWTLMYIFAQNIVRRKIYNWFWYTHNLYPLFFILMVLHGMGRLIQAPFFYFFFLGPVILFTIDSLISISRKKMEIPVIRAEILPSDVTMLEFRRPDNFQYKSGQWVRIACVGLNKHEYHPFTLSSSPDENNLTVHIRAVGPWTRLIRKLYDEMNKQNSLLPKIYLDGAFGEGHQDWHKYEVSVLIGGGIGVTPFASILKDVAYRAHLTQCKRVYFIWVSRTQKQFEWLVDIIRDLEYKDRDNVISCHIFITQFFEKFDLRTIFLYICERHYQRVSNRSLFTNLKAVTHFGRPHFEQFFKTASSLHENVHSIGVFSCGSPSMTLAVDVACNKVNAISSQRFEHHYKNF